MDPTAAIPYPSFGYTTLTLTKRALCTQIKRSRAPHEP
jgi:hypothetical protein